MLAGLAQPEKLHLQAGQFKFLDPQRREAQQVLLDQGQKHPIPAEVGDRSVLLRCDALDQTSTSALRPAHQAKERV